MFALPFARNAQKMAATPLSAAAGGYARARVEGERMRGACMLLHAGVHGAACRRQAACEKACAGAHICARGVFSEKHMVCLLFVAVVRGNGAGASVT